MRFRGFQGIIVLLFAAVLGCSQGDSLDRAPMRGTVTLDGKPVDHGMVALLPMEGTKAPQGAGAIQKDGTYEIETAGKPGAVVGRHKVIVQSREMLSPEEVRAMKVGRSLVPAQYSNYDTTPLTVDVPGEGTVFDIQMAR